MYVHTLRKHTPLTLMYLYTLQLRPGATYPALLVVAGLNDPRAASCCNSAPSPAVPLRKETAFLPNVHSSLLCLGLLGLALQALSCAAHLGRAAEPLRAQRGAAVRPRGPAGAADRAASST